MSCFDNLIALKGGCSETTLATAGVYLNDIGITREFIEKILSSDYAGVDDFVSSQVGLAVKKLTKDVYLKFSPKFNVKSIVEGQRLGYYPEFQTTSAAIAGTSKGIQTKIYNDTTFLNIFVSSISLYVNFSGTVNVTVYDLMDGTLLDTIPVTAVSGQIVTVTVNKTYTSNAREINLAFLYNAATVSGIQTPIIQGYCSGCYRGHGYRQNRYVWGNPISMLTASDKLQSNINFTSDTGGLSINYSLQCNHENWLCTNANFMALPLLYKTGYLMMDQAILYTEQMNSRTFDLAKLRERKEMYDFEYGREMDAILKNLRIPSGDVCFVCNRVAMTATVLPA